MKSVYVGFKFTHMGRYSGYDVVQRHAGYWKIIDCQNSFEWLAQFLNSGSLISKIYARVFGGRLWWVELYCLGLALLHRGLVFHFVYAENLYRHLGRFKWLGFKIVCTYHQPHKFLCESPQYLKGLKAVDHVILLSEKEVPAFRTWKGDDRVHFVPHGIDVDFFCPNNARHKERELLMVGNWLRDFTFAAEIFNDLLARFGDVDIHVVTLKENYDRFTSHDRLHLHCGIPDEDLVLRYQQATLLFLPLRGFVANNAVLEASACGCPILIATDQEERDETINWIEYVPLEKEIVVERIVRHLEAETGDGSGADIRELVVRKYGWRNIGEMTREILDNPG